MTAAAHRRRTRRQKTESIRVAVCIDTRDGPGRERLLGVYRYAQERNWELFLVRGHDTHALQQIAELRVDGAIFYDRPASFQRTVKGLGVVCVETGARNLELDDAAVFPDDTAIAEMAVKHLTDAGFEHLGYCGLVNSHPSSRRAESFVRAAIRIGITARTIEEPWPDGVAGLDSLIDWLRQEPKPAGVLAFDDKMAERVLASCRVAGIRVPDSIGVLGIGDDEVICELAYPRLSSVAVPTREIGRLAAERLESILQGRPPAKKALAVAPSEIVVRASTDRLPAAHPSVVAAIEFMRAGSHRAIGTEQVAGALGVSRRTLERRFQQDLGQTIHSYLVELRIRHAKQLLRQGDGALGEVARSCGYTGLSAFTQMFIAHVSCHPAAYRQRHKVGRMSR